MTSQRTKAALQAAKARGTELGVDRGKLPYVAHRGSQASSAKRMAEASSRVTDLAPIMARSAPQVHPRFVRSPPA